MGCRQLYPARAFELAVASCTPFVPFVPFVAILPLASCLLRLTFYRSCLLPHLPTFNQYPPSTLKTVPVI